MGEQMKESEHTSFLVGGGNDRVDLFYEKAPTVFIASANQISFAKSDYD